MRNVIKVKESNITDALKLCFAEKIDMPIQYTIFEKNKLVYALGSGHVTIDELLDHIEALANDPGYVSPMKKLVDYRTASLKTLSGNESIMFTDRKAQLRDFFKNEKCAIVVDTDLDFGLSRMHSFRIEESDIETNVFRNIKEALAWLQVSLDEKQLEQQ